MKQQRTSLLRRANLLLLAVGLVAALLAMGASWLAWRGVVSAYVKRGEEQTLRHYQTKLKESRLEWERDAARLKAQLEFLRIAELPGDQRIARLRAFFNAQAEYRDFQGILLVDGNGIPLFSLGCQTMLLDSLSLEELYVTSHCADARSLFAVLRTPIWLGQEGRGTALFGRALDHAMLNRITRGMDQVFLLHEGRVVASSLGESGLNALPASLADPEFMRIELSLEGTGWDSAPRLVVLRPLDSLVAAHQVVIGAAFLVLALLTLIWFGLGRGIRRHLKRIESMARVSGSFLVQFRRSEPMQQSLLALINRDDEVGRLSQALNRLMEEAEYRHAEQAAHLQTLDLLEEAVIELDLEGRIARVSSGWYKVTGIDTAAEGRMLADFIDPEDASVLENLLPAMIAGEKQQAHARLRQLKRGEEERWLELRLVRTEAGESLSGVLRDITQSYLQERRITHMALHDALTGLPNRILLEDRLQVAMRLVQRSQRKVVLGFIDLDHFKHVNDSLGHKMGDKLLVALSGRLRQHLRGGDTLARWGGDEFVVLLPDMPGLDAIREVAEKLRQATEAPLPVEDQEFNLTFSAGFAVYPDDADGGELLLAHADRAMFYAKSQGRNNLQFFADMSKKGLGKKEMYIQQRLATAIRERRIANHYQPLVQAKDGRIIGVETLARWQEPDLGWVSPATFIPMAESLGLIRELGELVWHQALDDMAAWRDQGLGLSVNLSKRQLFMPFFTEKLLEDVEAHGLEPGRITLEITESIALLDVEYATERLNELREAGFRLSIDDFGTGYSSLSQLHELPVHELKIDIAFVRRIHDPQGARLIQAIVGMADSLGLETVAEGVEDEATAARLRDMGVHLLQGWHFGRPMPAEELGSRLT